MRRDAKLHTEELSLHGELRSLDVELAVARQHVGADSSDLSKIVAFLRGDYEPGLRDALHRAVQDLAFTLEGMQRKARISWTGVLVLDDERTDRGLWRIPFAGTFDPGAVYVEAGLTGLMHLLRSGHVMRFAGGRLAQAQRELAAHAGVPQKRLKCLSANEPELVRLWTAVEFPQAVPGEDPGDVVTVDDLVADDDFVSHFGGREAASVLVERIRALADGDDDGGWLRPAALNASE